MRFRSFYCSMICDIRNILGGCGSPPHIDDSLREKLLKDFCENVELYTTTQDIDPFQSTPLEFAETRKLFVLQPILCLQNAVNLIENETHVVHVTSLYFCNLLFQLDARSNLWFRCVGRYRTTNNDLTAFSRQNLWFCGEIAV